MVPDVLQTKNFIQEGFSLPNQVGMKVGLWVENNVASAAATHNCFQSLSAGGPASRLAAVRRWYVSGWGRVSLSDKNDAPTLWLVLFWAAELTVYSYSDWALSLPSFLLAAWAAATNVVLLHPFRRKMELSEVMWLNSRAVAPLGPVLRGPAGLLLEVCLLLRPSHQRSSGGSLKITELFGKDQGAGGPSCGLGNLFRSFPMGLQMAGPLVN